MRVHPFRRSVPGFVVLAIMAGLTTVATSAAGDESTSATSSMPGTSTARASQPVEPVTAIIRPAKDGPWFVDSATGKRFTPFGINYTPREVQVSRRGVTRENWVQFDAPITDRDCARMAAVGANVIRVFLSTRSFVTEQGGVPEESLKKAQVLVAVAKKHGMRVIFGGPDWWEGESPLWPSGKYDTTGLYGPEQLESLERFWKSFAARFKDEPGVFSYSLRNEPMVPRQIPETCWQDFLKRKYGTPEAAGKAWGQVIAQWSDCKRPEDVDKDGDAWLYDYQLAREFVAYTWARRQVEAIRSVDKNHMVTNGGIQWDVPLFRMFPSSPYGYDGFDPHNFAGLYDYTSIHWYDIRPDNMRDDQVYLPLGERYFEGFLSYCRLGNKPLVLEEFPDVVMKNQAYSRSFYAHVSGALIWEYLDISSPEGMSPWARDLLPEVRAKLEARTPVSMDSPEVVAWPIEKKQLLTWYADPATFRHNPDWKKRTGQEDWHDAGGYWIDHYGELRNGGKTRIRFELKGEGPEFFDQMYRKQAD